MIFYLFRKYPDKNFIIIADYKKEVLRRYLEAFADVRFNIIDADGDGTCGGLAQAIEIIPEKEAFMLVWSDLILSRDLKLPDEYENIYETPGSDYIGISKTFSCRWSYKEGCFREERTKEYGVAGLFLFSDKGKISDVPQSGELVRWMSEKGFIFREISLAGTREFGVLEEYNRLEAEKTRPFNRITGDEKYIIKEPVDKQGEGLAKREVAWYKKANKFNISALPQIYCFSPLKMERIKGKNIYEMNLAYPEKQEVLNKIISELKKLHGCSVIPADRASIKEVYFNKTFSRLSKVIDLVPFAKDEYIIINEKKCKNVFFLKKELEEEFDKFSCEKFSFIHGDCTFSNIMIRGNGNPVFIDPRGYFGFSEVYGDERYDWAKLYYSIVGNYDRFNLKDFSLIIEENSVHLDIASNGWEDMEDVFFNLTGADRWEIKMIHAVIWLSLTTYAWQDYDSICGAFYNGLYYLNEALNPEKASDKD